MHHGAVSGPCVLPRAHDGECSPVFQGRHWDMATGLLEALLLELVRDRAHGLALQAGRLLATMRRYREQGLL